MDSKEKGLLNITMAHIMYPFIDLAVHEAIRERYTNGDALVIVSTDFDQIIWANGPAARLFNHETIYDFIDAGLIDNKQTKNKLHETAQQLITNQAIRNVDLQILPNNDGTELDLILQLIKLPKGEQAILVIAHMNKNPAGGILDVDHIICGFTDTDACVAVLGKQGQVLGATEHFYALDINLQNRRAMTQDVSMETNRLIKRPLTTKKGDLPAAIGYLCENPDIYLLFAVDTQGEDEDMDVSYSSLPASSSATGTSSATTHDISATDDRAHDQDINDNISFAKSEAKNTVLQSLTDEKKDSFIFESTQPSVRFVWKTDAAGIFTEISPELGKAIGPNAVDVLGRKFTDVALVFNLNPSEEIVDLIRRRDTWSGKTVMWPVQGTGLCVPVDLAALPTYTRDRLFDGYRGFGIARIHEATSDPQSIGFALMGGSYEQTIKTIENAKTSNFKNANLSYNIDKSIDKSDEPDELSSETADKLTENEQSAFLEIRKQLGQISPLESEQSLDISSRDDTDNRFEYNNEIDEAIPVLIYAGDDLLFANQAFFELTGYQDLNQLQDLGGIPYLLSQSNEFADGEFDKDKQHRDLTLKLADNNIIPIDIRMHSSKWKNQNALKLSLQTPQASPPIISRDLSAQDLSEETERLKIKISDLTSILETATDGVIIIDEHSKIQSLNASASALFDYNPDEVIGQSFSMLFAPESQQVVLDYVDVLAGTNVASLLNDGCKIIGQVSSGGILPLFMTMGRLSGSEGYCAVLRDISQSKQVEEELQAAKTQAESASSHKTEFLARVSHEIRTPLNAIIGFSDLILQERFGPIGHPRYVEYAHDIGKSGRHVLDIVNDLLDISKIEAGQEELNFQAVSLNDETRESLSLMQQIANESRVIVRSSLSPNIPSVIADKRSIKQILLNILSNSIRFTPAGGQIVVSSSIEALGHVFLRIRDNGIGMSRTELERAMQPFTQVGQETRQRGDGTGLGLPLTRAMTEANRAKFDIVSSPGKGTLVTIDFPPQRVLAE